jgi:hypothetical protein
VTLLHSERTVRGDRPDAGVVSQGGQSTRRDAGGDAVHDGQVPHDPAAVTPHGSRCRSSGDALDDDPGLPAPGSGPGGTGHAGAQDQGGGR